MCNGEGAIIAREKEKIIQFVNSSDQIYIYGGGNVAKAVLDILENEGITIAGIIISRQDGSKCRDYPLFTVNEAKKWITRRDGVILGYAGARKAEIMDRFAPAEPLILEIDYLAVLALNDDIRFLPIIQNKINRVGKGEPIDRIKDCRSFLVIRLDMIGDFIFITPFIRELRRNFPDSKITLLIKRQNYFLAKECPYIDELLLYDCPFIEGELSRQCEEYGRAERRAKAFANQYFAGKEFDCVFFTRELLSGRNILDEFFLGFYSGAKIRIGKQILLSDVYGEHLYGLIRDLYSFVSRHRETMHEAEYTLQILKDIGLCVQDDKMELWVDEESQLYADSIVGQRKKTDGTVIAFGLVASVPSRTWFQDNYVQLIRLLYRNNGDKYLYIFMGGSDAVSTADYIIKNLEDNEKRSVINLTGVMNLIQTEGFMRNCDIYIGPNTGLLHMASAFRIPSITIYSELDDGDPTDGDSPVRMGAWRVKHMDLIPPAGLDGCHKVCRMKYSHCINQIKPKHVVEALKMLDEQRDE